MFWWLNRKTCLQINFWGLGNKVFRKHMSQVFDLMIIFQIMANIVSLLNMFPLAIYFLFDNCHLLEIVILVLVDYPAITVTGLITSCWCCC